MSLLTFFGGLVVAGVASVVIAILGKAEQRAASRALAQEHCPKCGAHGHGEAGDESDRHCDQCGSVLSPLGVERL